MNAENLAPTGIRSLDRRGHYTNYAIPAHNAMQYRGEIHTGFWRRDMKRGDGSIPFEKKRTGINSCPSQKYRAVSCGLDLLDSCEQGNELSGGIIFQLKNSQLLKNVSVRWRQLVRAICWTTTQAFSVFYRRTTALRLFLVLVLMQIFFCIDRLYVNDRIFPLR